MTVQVGRTESRAAHLLHVTYTGPEAGQAITACGVKPFERLDPSKVRFRTSTERPRCGTCQEGELESVE